MLTQSEKAEVIKRYASNPKDTGAAVVQIALLSKRIENIAPHLKANKKDYSSGRGLLKLVGQRRSLIRYLKRTDPVAAKKLLTDLDLK
ncbi:MAG: 30S ribosomal protein S15 [Elusimicrobia bacterium]|nr:30S ribosomal protein S15 [Elusimicrobiota bacterium]